MLRINDHFKKWLRFFKLDKSTSLDTKTDSEPEVQLALQNAHKEVLALEAKLDEYKWLEGALRNRTWELNERMKELDCLYSLISYSAHDSFTLEQLLQFVIKQIPFGWQNPQATCVRIVLDGHEYRSARFRQTSLKQSADIYQNGRQLGILEICVLPEIMKNHEQPFLNEEQRLLNAIALWIGAIIGNQNMNGQK